MACLKVIQMGAAKFCAMALAHRERTLIPLYGFPLWRSGRVIRPAACSAFHGLTQGLTPFSKWLTIWLVIRVWTSCFSVRCRTLSFPKIDGEKESAAADSSPSSPPCHHRGEDVQTSPKRTSGPEQFPDCSLNASVLLGALRPELRTR